VFLEASVKRSLFSSTQCDLYGKEKQSQRKKPSVMAGSVSPSSFWKSSTIGFIGCRAFSLCMQSSSVREPGRDVHDVQIPTLYMDVLTLGLTRMKVAVLGLPSLDFHAFPTDRQT